MESDCVFLTKFRFGLAGSGCTLCFLGCLGEEETEKGAGEGGREAGGLGKGGRGREAGEEKEGGRERGREGGRQGGSRSP